VIQISRGFWGHHQHLLVCVEHTLLPLGGTRMTVK
jgi:hypothetical protein